MNIESQNGARSTISMPSHRLGGKFYEKFAYIHFNVLSK